MVSPTPSPAGEPTSDEKIMAAIAYLGAMILYIPTLVIFLLKKDESRFIKFHCLQTFSFLVVGIIMIAINIALGIVGTIPVVGVIVGLGAGLLFMLLGLVMFCYWVFLIIKAFQGEEYEIPFVGNYIKQNLMN